MKTLSTLIATILPATFVLTNPISAKAGEIYAGDLLHTRRVARLETLDHLASQQGVLARKQSQRLSDAWPITKMST
jgi:hypothetical protein